MSKSAAGVVALAAGVLVAACGGGSGSLGTAGASGPPPANSISVIVDAGPAAIPAAGFTEFNTLYATVTICTPGSTSACQSIDHVQVDTGSIGLALIAGALNGAAAPRALDDPATGQPLMECVQFADGYTWGSVVTVDVQIGERTISSLPVHLMGDAAAGTAPSDCVSGAPEDTVLAFGANGILGVGSFLQDCGTACADGAQPATYYVCTNGICSATPVALANQLTNPIGALAADNNGVMISLPGIPSGGATSITGTLYFGVATQNDNALGSAQGFTVDGSGALYTNYAGTAVAGSVIDSGSNAYFFTSNLIATCADYTSFYCPATSMPENATIQGLNGVISAVDFTVANTDQLFAVGGTAFPDLAGPNSGNGIVPGSFDWGLPFFFGRNVYVIFEAGSAGGIAGPAVAF